MLFRVCFLVALVSANAHAGVRVPSCHNDMPLAAPLTAPLPARAWNEGSHTSFGGVKGGVPQKLVQEPLVQEPIVEQQHFIQEPLVQEPLVQEPLVQEPLVQEPLVQEPLVQEPIEQLPIQQKEIFPIKGQQPLVQEPLPVQEPLRELPVQQVNQEPIVPLQQQELDNGNYGSDSILIPTYNTPTYNTAPMSRGAQLLNLPHGVDNIMSGISTTFSCWGRAYGYFADVANNCQIFHICHAVLKEGVYEMSRSSFFCPENTIFDQIKHTCYPIDDALPCAQAISYYPHTEQRFAAPAMYHSNNFGNTGLESSRFESYATKGGSTSNTFMRSNPLPLPMMRAETLPSKTTMRVESYPVKGGPVRAPVKGYRALPTIVTTTTTESYPVKGQVRSEVIPNYPVKGQVRAEIPETYPVKGRVEVPETFPVKGVHTTLAPEPIRILPVTKGQTRTEIFKGQHIQPTTTFNNQRLVQPQLIQSLPAPLQYNRLPLSPSRSLKLQQ